MKFSILAFLLLLFSTCLSAQYGEVKGIVKDEKGNTLHGVNIITKDGSLGTTSDRSGNYSIEIPASDSVTLTFSHIGYQTFQHTLFIQPQEVRELNIHLSEQTSMLSTIEIEGARDHRDEVSVTKIEPKTLTSLPSPFGDFNKILSTLPGVVSNNELSSTYSVRGGSFDENLIYVNDIPVYRPFIISNGQQEGLSFVNSDLVKAITFSAGGWQPKYGDKLSSVLNVNYKEPAAFGASLTLGLLGGTAHVEGASGSGKLTYVGGVRHKSSQYLLNTLETEGEYLPKFTDFQGYVNYSVNNKTTLSFLGAYARNRYLVEPESRETEFGTFDRSFRLFVGFDGRETLEYDTYQGGMKLSHELAANLKSDIILSGVYALEREYTDIEGGYRLCDVDKNLGSDTFNECVVIRGIGTNYDYGRNSLKANIINLENRNTYKINESNRLEFGLGYSYQQIEDQLQEFSFRDSADFVIDISALEADHTLENIQYSGYIQQTQQVSEKITSTYGFRITYLDLNQQFLISPRAQFSYRTGWERDVVFTFAAGIYQQPPFFRELRDPEGTINSDIKAQKSVHLIGGMDYNFKWWGRDFKLISEAYFKYIRDVIPYDIDNVKVRYYADNNASAFATGADFRISGEFIEGIESWFSLGVLNTRENVQSDGRSFIRRPTDQRVNMAVFFQDHLPNNPTFRVSLNLFIGSGLPFGPPNNFEKRNVFDGDTYKRLDIGFSKVLYLKEAMQTPQLTISAEILNLLGVSNAISYTWITDVTNSQFAVPNTLSARFLNIKLSLKL